MLSNAADAAATVHLPDLRKGMPGITESFGDCLCDAASVCLENRQHASGVAMAVSGSLNSDPLRVTWESPSETALRCYNDLGFAAEFGAYGVAALVVERLTGYTVYERSRKGTGFDFWLAPKDAAAAPLFQEKRRLEVSGLLDGEESEFKRRMQGKLDQLANGGVELLGYGLVVHFGRPESRIVVAAP
jgi:hypothetical protein